MTQVALTGNFLATARCLIFADGGGVVWAFNPNTNTITAASSGGGATGSAHPSAVIGLTAVNGALSTYMTSDSAPALSQAIAPTWTNPHTFNANMTVGSTLTDGSASVGTNGQVLSSTVTGVKWVAAGGGGLSSANPTATIGLAAVNGSAGTYMTSDSAPPLSQAIAPTWTGEHTFTPGGAYPGIVVNAASAHYGITIAGNSSAGNSLGLYANAGTTSADWCFRFWNQAGSTNFLECTGAGVLTMGGNTLPMTAATKGDLWYASAAGAISALGVGSTGYLLTVASGVPAWEAVPTWNQNTTGSSASCTGNAATATNVAASGITGTTLAASVVASSLTSFGASIALGTPASGTLTNCTFPTLNQNTTGSSGSCTGNAATATTAAACSGNAATATNIAGGTANQIPYQTGAGATSFFSASNYGVQTYGATGVPASIAGAAGVLVGSASAIPAFSLTPSGLTSVTATTFNGALVGNVTGNVSGSSGSSTGNAATATNVAYSGLTGTVPTWNQNTTGTAATATNLGGAPVGGSFKLAGSSWLRTMARRGYHTIDLARQPATTLQAKAIWASFFFPAQYGCIPFQTAGGVTELLPYSVNGLYLTANAAGAPQWTCPSANPTGLIGLSAVAGVSMSFMRADGAPALSQAIVPTWTGKHTFNGGVVLGAGTTTLAPLVLTSGTNLTSAAAGAIEYDGTCSYLTNETTAGRGLLASEQYFHLAADGGGITTIANFFGSTSNIPLVSGGYYEIEITLYYVVGATGSVVTWTLTNSAAPTSMDLYYEMCPITGMVAPPGTATMLVGQILGGVTAAQTVVTGALTGGTNQYAKFRIMLKNGTGTSLKIQATETTQTTSLTPKIGSYWKCKRIPSGNVGTFAA